MPQITKVSQAGGVRFPVLGDFTWFFLELAFGHWLSCRDFASQYQFNYLYLLRKLCLHNNVSVVSNSLWPHGLQHTRPPCPSPAPRVDSSSCPLSWWCHQTISSSVVPFSSHLQSLPASRFFQISQFFSSGGQSIGVSASTSVHPMNTKDWFPLGWTGWISCSPRDSQESFPTPPLKSINSSVLNFLYSPTLTSIHDYWKNHSLD